MTDIDRYIDTLPLDPVPEQLLRAMIEDPDRWYLLDELAGRIGYSIKYTHDQARALMQCGAVRRHKEHYRSQPRFCLADPRLLQHLGIDRLPEAGDGRPEGRISNRKLNQENYVNAI